MLVNIVLGDHRDFPHRDGVQVIRTAMHATTFQRVIETLEAGESHRSAGSAACRQSNEELAALASITSKADRMVAAEEVTGVSDLASSLISNVK